MAFTLPALLRPLAAANRPLRRRRVSKIALLAAATVCLPLIMPSGTAPAASAGETRWSITLGNHGKTFSKSHFSNKHHRSHDFRHRSRGYHDRGHSHYRVAKHHKKRHGSHTGGPSRGYYKQVWVPPVYATHYDACGQPYQVRVSHGYAKQVFVSTSRNRDYHRRGQWDSSGSHDRY